MPGTDLYDVLNRLQDAYTLDGLDPEGETICLVTECQRKYQPV